MRAIERMTIQGYKSIREMELDLRPLNILIGANGAGKSNFISIFKFFHELINENLQLHVAKAGGANAFLYFGRQITGELHLHIEFAQNTQVLIHTYSCTLVPSAEDVFVFANEYADFHDQQTDAIRFARLGTGQVETRLNQQSKRQDVARFVKEAMLNWRIYHFHDTSESAKIKLTGDLHDNRFLRSDASNLAAYLYLLQETELDYYQNIVNAIRLIAPFFNDFALRPSPFNPEKIRLEWQERGSDMVFGASALSDGTLRFISLATLLLQPPDKLPSTILLDEPELGLHPYAITVLANLLQSAAERTQVIVSTQSVTLVNQFDPEDIIVVDREDGQSVFRHLAPDAIDDWLEDYGLGELWEKNVLGGRPT
ncbi:MAG: AAA family ATPase [Anaerolineales bacterium]|nr:AAA family ATPase [Anaerolineales bacterium]